MSIPWMVTGVGDWSTTSFLVSNKPTLTNYLSYSNSTCVFKWYFFVIDGLISLCRATTCWWLTATAQSVQTSTPAKIHSVYSASLQKRVSIKQSHGITDWLNTSSHHSLLSSCTSCSLKLVLRAIACTVVSRFIQSQRAW